MDRYDMQDDVRARLGDYEVSDEALDAYLDSAESAMVSWLWPFDSTKRVEDVPEVLHPRICEVAVALIARQGMEGETDHTENGTSRTFADAGVPVSLLSDIPRHAGVPR